MSVLQLNIYLMAFNLLLPAYPLDGGRIFADLLLLCGVPLKAAAITTVVLAALISGGLIAWGIIEVAILTVAVSPQELIYSFSRNFHWSGFTLQLPSWPRVIKRGLL